MYHLFVIIKYKHSFSRYSNDVLRRRRQCIRQQIKTIAMSITAECKY